MTTKSLLILAGDGIGPEVMTQVKRVITWFNEHSTVTFQVEEGLVGGCSYDAHGTPLTDVTMAKAMEADAVLLGAVGGPKWDNLPFADKPERGLLRLRKDMQLFAS
jgi:3-isopropylmalate dehydrogenase